MNINNCLMVFVNQAILVPILNYNTFSSSNSGKSIFKYYYSMLLTSNAWPFIFYRAKPTIFCRNYFLNAQYFVEIIYSIEMPAD